ncbi:probable glycosyltransferase At3g07620 isoform X2 [Rhodamnia argentea]|uniref:Probable glycosyltransferase At3g07620 isoform X2 n=1 Tax=Rhodamnia argentea TaxID=178133 RepID=A0A8B8P871_9MYRT|nr:probable glycosyltransferase At3g07620 isoform X2 [Rhodamnia argentea]
MRRLLFITGIFVTALVVFQYSTLPHGRTGFAFVVGGGVGSTVVAMSNANISDNSKSPDSYILHEESDEFAGSDSEEESSFQNMGVKDADKALRNSDDSFSPHKSSNLNENSISMMSVHHEKDLQSGNHDDVNIVSTVEEATNPITISRKSLPDEDADLRSISEFRTDFSNISNFGIPAKQEAKRNANKLRVVSATLGDKSTMARALKRLNVKPMLISEMVSLLRQSAGSSNSSRPRWSSVRDRELLYAKLEIQKAPITANTAGLTGYVFRNVSQFKRSYELMEKTLKVYVYREGEKPIFHQPKMRGIYSSEGWFMKLMEGNKKFVVRDPRKAHLFYLPFSSQMLRKTLDNNNSQSHRDLEGYLKNYVDLISGKYRFWNRSRGADHFLVACHDWASKITRQPLGNCIRALCNANVARGFIIGKDTTLPVTYVRSVEDPGRDIGGKPPIQRAILAFFAGSMHGYLRPILRHYWENKEADMKILGPMPRDIDGKRAYREYMKSSRYCICARGYEVHTPRIIEAIFYECIPVIISDNYVPPFLEVLNWEAFSLFVKESDVPKLRDILLSIPEEEYLRMQMGVRMVQKHFIWHKKPTKYDLFHMVLHSIWHNRIFQLKTR